MMRYLAGFLVERRASSPASAIVVEAPKALGEVDRDAGARLRVGARAGVSIAWIALETGGGDEADWSALHDHPTRARTVARRLAATLRARVWLVTRVDAHGDASTSIDVFGPTAKHHAKQVGTLADLAELARDAAVSVRELAIVIQRVGKHWSTPLPDGPFDALEAYLEAPPELPDRDIEEPDANARLRVEQWIARRIRHAAKARGVRAGELLASWWARERAHVDAMTEARSTPWREPDAEARSEDEDVPVEVRLPEDVLAWLRATSARLDRDASWLLTAIALRGLDGGPSSDAPIEPPPDAPGEASPALSGNAQRDASSGTPRGRKSKRIARSDRASNDGDLRRALGAPHRAASRAAGRFALALAVVAALLLLAGGSSVARTFQLVVAAGAIGSGAYALASARLARRIERLDDPKRLTAIVVRDETPSFPEARWGMTFEIDHDRGFHPWATAVDLARFVEVARAFAPAVLLRVRHDGEDRVVHEGARVRAREEDHALEERLGAALGAPARVG